jgi:hypothetical protein
MGIAVLRRKTGSPLSRGRADYSDHFRLRVSSSSQSLFACRRLPALPGSPRFCHRPRRRRHQAFRSSDALCRGRAPRHGIAAQRADNPRPQRGEESIGETTTAWYVSNVLLGTLPPENGALGRIAFKTGTSYGYRNAWSIGFDDKHTIGIWVGCPDGAPVPGLVGRAAGRHLSCSTPSPVWPGRRFRCRLRPRVSS